MEGVSVALEERLRHRAQERASLPPLPSAAGSASRSEAANGGGVRGVNGPATTNAAAAAAAASTAAGAAGSAGGTAGALGVTDASLGSEQQGLLFHQSVAKAGTTKIKLKRRWCVVSDGYMFVYKWKGKDKENVAIANIKAQLNLLLCSVKP
jgi:hypothetical protein